MQCVILAGGLGTRMLPLTRTMPKTLIPVLGRPFADWQLAWLARQGVRRVVYCLGYLADAVRAHVGDGSARGFERVDYVEDGDRPLGTGGALRQAMDAGALEESFLVLYGDSYLPVEVAPLWRAAGEGQLPTMAVLRNEGCWDGSNVVLRDGRVVRYEKGRADAAAIGMNHIDYGISVLQRRLVAERLPPATPQDLGLLYSALADEGRLRGFEVDRRFYEIGSPAGLRDLEAFLGAGESAGGAP